MSDGLYIHLSTKCLRGSNTDVNVVNLGLDVTVPHLLPRALPRLRDVLLWNTDWDYAW